jgi:ribbon-helix-helix CopG family protein
VTYFHGREKATQSCVRSDAFGRFGVMYDAHVRVTLRLPKDLAEQVRQRAEDRGTTQNDWMVRAIAATLRRTVNEPVTIREVVL